MAHKRNPFTSRDDEIRRLKAELGQLRLKIMLDSSPFFPRLGENLALLMAQLHPDDWTQGQRAAFDYARNRAPTVADYWLQQCKTNRKVKD